MVVDISSQMINQLFSLYPGKHSYGKEKSIVSRYAAFQLARTRGPELVKTLANAIGRACSRSMYDWLLEMSFFARLTNGGLKIYNHKKMTMEWKRSRVSLVDIKNGGFPLFGPQVRVWLKPQEWNQDGYDAVFLDNCIGLVRFVRVSNEETLSFKIEYFAAFLEAMRNSKVAFEIKNVVIVVVVDWNNLGRCKISNITGQGLLSSFKGWKKGQEKNRIKIFGMQVSSD